jgi:hypothetical protein
MAEESDSLFTAALLKLSFRLACNDHVPGYQNVYQGVLRDLELEDEAVEKYLEHNYDTVLKAARGKERGED